MGGTLLDAAVVVVVVLAVVLGARTGWRTGASRSALSLAGLVAGLLLGLAVASWLVSDATSPLVGLLLAAVCAVGGALLGASLGGAVGDLLGRALGRLHLGLLDRGAGAVLRGGVCLVVCSLLAGAVLALAPAGSALATSGAVGGLSRVAPPAGAAAAAQLRAVLPGGSGSDLLALVPVSATTRAAPDAEELARATQRAGSSVVLVRAAGGSGRCAVGTGFVAADAATGARFAVTNAHVVGSSRRVVVQGAQGTSSARVVVDDVDADIAVLAVDGATGPALPLAQEPAANGTAAVVLGHPRGGPLTAVPAVVLQRLPVLATTSGGWSAWGAADAQGAGDERSDGQVVGLREAYRLAADVQPGNSGSPLLDLDGDVVGVVNASGLGASGTGYALELTAVRADLATAAAASTTDSSTTGSSTTTTDSSTTGSSTTTTTHRGGASDGC